MRRDRIDVYRDRSGGWRWRYVRSNGRIMATGAESYVDRRDAIYGAERVCCIPPGPNSWNRIAAGLYRRRL